MFRQCVASIVLLLFGFSTFSAGAAQEVSFPKVPLTVDTKKGYRGTWKDIATVLYVNSSALQGSYTNRQFVLEYLRVNDLFTKDGAVSRRYSQPFVGVTKVTVPRLCWYPAGGPTESLPEKVALSPRCVPEEAFGVMYHVYKDSLNETVYPNAKTFGEQACYALQGQGLSCDEKPEKPMEVVLPDNMTGIANIVHSRIGAMDDRVIEQERTTRKLKDDVGGLQRELQAGLTAAGERMDAVWNQLKGIANRTDTLAEKSEQNALQTAKLAADIEDVREATEKNAKDVVRMREDVDRLEKETKTNTGGVQDNTNAIAGLFWWLIALSAMLGVLVVSMVTGFISSRRRRAKQQPKKKRSLSSVPSSGDNDGSSGAQTSAGQAA